MNPSVLPGVFTQPRRLVDLQGRSFNEPMLGSWYNLETGRVVKNPRSDRPYVTISDPRVLGHQSSVDQFLINNRLPPRPKPHELLRNINQRLGFVQPLTVAPQNNVVEKVRRPLPLPPQPTTFEWTTKLSQQTVTRPSSPLRQATGAYQGGLCTPGGSGVYQLQTNDIEAIPNEILSSLCNFKLVNLRVKAKVIYVVDGDTVDLAFFLPFEHLTRTHLEGRGLNRRPVQPALTFGHGTNAQSGMVVRYRCRLNGIDAAESKTQQGQLATRLMREKFTSLNNIVYIVGSAMDLYGRLLVDLYEDPGYQRNFTRYLIGIVDPVLGRIAEAYEGGTKSEYMKNLPTV